MEKFIEMYNQFYTWYLNLWYNTIGETATNAIGAFVTVGTFLACMFYIVSWIDERITRER